MTNKEIKFALAKIALVQCVPMDSVKQMYEWITEEEKTDVDTKTQDDNPKSIYDTKPISEVVEQVEKTVYFNSCYPSKLSEVFVKNDIKTVGDLLNIGRKMFKRYRSVGAGSLKRVDEALNELYGIKEW